jgi:hypothetical protein
VLGAAGARPLIVRAGERAAGGSVAARESRAATLAGSSQKTGISQVYRCLCIIG